MSTDLWNDSKPSEVALHLPTAALAMRLAVDAYMDEEELLKRDLPDSVNIEMFAVDDIEGVVYRGEMEGRRVVLISIRGNDFSWRDVWRNAHIFLTPIPWREGGKAAQGYLQAVWSLEKVVSDLVSDLQDSWLIVCGHGHGGGDALILAEYLLQKHNLDHRDVLVFTGGAPAVYGAGRGADLIRTYRLVMDDDLVPLLRLPKLGATHERILPGHKYFGAIFETYLIDSKSGAIEGMSVSKADWTQLFRLVTHYLADKKVLHRLTGGFLSSKASEYAHKLEILAK